MNHPEQAARSVMSVSPHDARRPETPNNGADIADDIFLAPRVVDQRAFDELSSRLSALIRQATETTAHLTQQLHRAAETDAQSTRVMVQLQERLRLSARMLKAVQGQSSQIDAAVERMRELHTIGDLPSALEHTLQQRVEALLERAAARLDAHTEVRRSELRALEDQIQVLLPQAEKLSQLVESAEVNIAVLSHKSAQGSVQAETAACHLQQSIDQCADAEQRLTDLTAQSQDIIDLMNGAIRRCESMQRSAGAAGAGPGETDRGVDIGVCERLEMLLDRLKPWEPMLTRNVIVEPMDREHDALFARLRAELGAELGAMSQSIRRVFERMDKLTSADEQSDAAREFESERIPEVVAERTDKAIQPSGRLRLREDRV